MKKIFFSVISIVLVAVMVFSSPATYVAAALTEEYISDLKTVSADNAEDAKSQLEENGYTVIDTNLRQGNGGKCVYMGFKTTTDKELAITDVKIGSMASGMKTIKYKELVGTWNSQMRTLARKVKVMVNETKKNAAAGSYLAKAAIESVNLYSYEDEDTARTPLFDFLDKTTIESGKIQDIFLIATDVITNAIYSSLSMGAVKPDENFIESIAGIDANDFWPSADDSDTLTYRSYAGKMMAQIKNYSQMYYEGIEYVEGISD